MCGVIHSSLLVRPGGLFCSKPRRRSTTETKGRYGYRRVHQILLRQGHRCGPELVRDLMKQAGIRGCQPKKWQVTTRPDKEAAAMVPDLVRRDFTAATAGAKLVGDITYVHTWEGWVRDRDRLLFESCCWMGCSRPYA